jgi:prevent-host-death family protein
MNWHLQDAKNNFSKLVDKAITEGPQTVTRRGRRTAVILSAEEYDRLVQPRKSLAEFLMEEGPEWDDDFVRDVNTRSKSPGREIDL